MIERAQGDFEVVVAGADDASEAAVREFGLGTPHVVELGSHDATADEAVRVALVRRATLLKGSVSTPALARALLRAGTQSRLVHVSLLGFPALDRVAVLADAGINLEPDGDTQVEIAERALEVARALGLEGGICLLGHAESADLRISSSRRALEWVARLTAHFAERGISVAGPLSLDLALSESARRKKQSALPTFDVVVAPDIIVANVLFKAVMLAGSVAAGVIASEEDVVALPSRAGTIAEKGVSLALARLLGLARTVRPPG